jgi:hypothetical protein
MVEDDACFVISPIGDEGSPTRQRSDKVLDYFIEPVVTEYGYEPVRADEIGDPGMITSQVIEYAVDSPLAIADLTNHNPNVFYELAVRHTYREPVIQIISSDESIPFDIADTRTIHIDIDDIESVETAKDEMREQIESIEDDEAHVETPISVARDLKQLRESGDPEDRSMAEIKEALTELRTSITTLQGQINEPHNILPPEYMEEIFESIGLNPVSKHELIRFSNNVLSHSEEIISVASDNGDDEIVDIADEIIQETSRLKNFVMQHNLNAIE